MTEAMQYLSHTRGSGSRERSHSHFLVYQCPWVQGNFQILNSREQSLSLHVSLVVQGFRICLLIQGTQVWPLVWEDSTCSRATKPVCSNWQSFCTLGPIRLIKRSPRNKKSEHCNWTAALPQQRPSQKWINKSFYQDAHMLLYLCPHDPPG